MAQWTFLQNRNRFTNFEIKLMVTKGKPWINQRMGFPHSSVGKESACSAGDSSSTPGLGRSSGEGIGSPLQYSWASLVAQLVKNLPAMQESLVRFLGWEEPLEREGIGYPLQYSWASLVIQLVKNLLAMQETWVHCVGWEDPLKKEKATHSSILAWKIPWTILSKGSQRVVHDWATFSV